jgi:hypothetical protein
VFEEQVIQIADDMRHDFRTVIKNGQEKRVPDPDMVARAKLRIDVRFRHLKAFRPQRWVTALPSLQSLTILLTRPICQQNSLRRRSRPLKISLASREWRKMGLKRSFIATLVRSRLVCRARPTRLPPDRN